MAKIRLEWVRAGRPDFQRGDSNDLALFFGQQTLTVSSSSVLSGAAPAFTGSDGISAARGLARVSVLSGAVIIAWGGAAPTVSETTGLRLEAGQVQLFAVDTGDALAFIEALDTPGVRLVQDTAAGTDLQAIATALQGTLAVSGPLTNAQAAALALATASGQSAILGALQGTLAVSGPLTNAQALALGLATASGQSAIQAALQGSLAVTASPIHATATSRCGTLAAANTPQDLMPANATRNGWTIQNQSSGNLYVRSKGSAGTTLATLDQNSLIIPPGAAYDPPKVSPHALSIVGAAAGQAFFAEEW